MTAAVRLVVITCLLFAAGVARAQEEAGDEDPAIVRATVEAIEWKRQDAMVRADRTALEKIYSEDLSYTHSMALTQTREQLLDMITAGSISYEKFTTQSMEWRVYDGAAVGSGSQTIDLIINDEPVTARNRYTVVYIKLDGQWRCVAYQSTPLPDVRETRVTR